MKGNTIPVGTLLCRGVRFEGHNFFWMVVWQAGAWLLACLVMAVVSLFVKEDVLGVVDVPGLCALVVGTFFFFFEGVNLFGAQYALLVGLGVSRRRAVALGWALSVLAGAVELAVVALLNTVWRVVLATPGQFAEILSLIPFWGWAALLLLPPCFAVMGTAVVRKFGRIGVLVLYLLFLGVCFSPNALRSGEGYLTVEQVVTALPWIFLTIGAACALLGSVLLLRASLNNG